MLDAYNVVWTSPSANSGESMPCGGGDVGLNVWVEGGDLLVYLSRSGTFDELNGMPKLGRLRVTLSPNPFDAPTLFRQELKLQDGFVQIFGEKDGLAVTVDVWVDVHRPVVHVDVSSNQPTDVIAAYESWRLSDRPFGKAEVHAARSWAGAPETGTVRADAVDFDDDAVRFVHRNAGRTAFDLCVEQQGLSHVRDQLWNSLRDLTFGGTFGGEAFVPAGTQEGVYASTPFKAWRLRSAAPATSHRLVAALHVANAPTIDDWNAGLLAIERDAAATDASSRGATLAWWHAFWERSHVFIRPGNADSSDPVWQVGRNYTLFRYQLGCNANGRWPTKFNGGLFTYDPAYVDPKKTFSPDFRQWGGGSFTAQNQRLVYWPMLKSGDFDMMSPQLEFYRRALANAELRSKEYWGIEGGACFAEQIENFGLPVAFEYGWKRPPDMPHGVEHNAWVDHQWDTAFEFCLMALDLNAHLASPRGTGFQPVFPRSNHGLETRATVEAYLPLIESCLHFYDAFYRKTCRDRTGKELGDDGKLVISPGTSLETYKNALNPTPTIAALRTVLEAVVALPDELMPADRRARWRTMLATIPDFAYRDKDGHRTISPAWEWSHKQNCELPQLYPVYPYRQFGVGRPDLQTAIDTWRYGTDAPDQKQIQSWHQDAIFCARLGLTDEAAALTIDKLKDAPRRFPTFWGPGHDWVPDHNWGGSGMIGLQEMLVQTVGDTIHLLPAWPREWDVDFKLHLPGRTTIECVVRGGRIEHVIVDPQDRQKDVVRPAWDSRRDGCS